eukprot:Polyplicarium_translucidae@DN4459_c0_g1_i1.p1
MMDFPKPLIEPAQRTKFLKDPEVLTLELLFVLSSVLNVLILYRLLLNVVPFPVALTWFQLLGGLISAVVLGAAGEQFPSLAYFPPFSFSMSKAKELLLPTTVFLGMITLGNVPVVVSAAVVLHHASRFLGCGQVYVPVRWTAVGVMGLGFLLAAFDWRTLGPLLFLVALLYAVCSSVFRGWCLEKALHVVEGRGNQLHNQQVAHSRSPRHFLSGCGWPRFVALDDSPHWRLAGCHLDAPQLLEVLLLAEMGLPCDRRLPPVPQKHRREPPHQEDSASTMARPRAHQRRHRVHDGHRPLPQRVDPRLDLHIPCVLWERTRHAGCHFARRTRAPNARPPNCTAPVPRSSEHL